MTNTTRLFSIILLSLAAFCGEIEIKLKNINSERHELLKVYSGFMESNPKLKLATTMNELLEITSNPSHEEWLAFIGGVQTSNNDIVSRGDQNLDEQELTVRLLKLVEKFYPAVNSEAFNKLNQKWEKNDEGYLIMTSFLLEEARRLVIRYSIVQLFNVFKNNAEVIIQPKNAWNSFLTTVLYRIKDYATFYNPDIKTVVKTEKGSTTYTKSNPRITEIFNQMQTRMNNYYKIMIFTIFKQANEMLNFKNNLNFYLVKEFEYLTTYAKIAPENEFNSLLVSLEDVTKKLIMVNLIEGKEYSSNQFMNGLIGDYADEMKDNTLELLTYKIVYLPQIIKTILVVLKEQVDLKTSFVVAKSFMENRYRDVKYSKTLALKSSLMPLLTKHYLDNPIEADYLTSWDWIMEYEEGVSNWDNVYQEFWNIAVHKSDQILKIAQNKLDALIAGRPLSLNYLIESNENKEIFAVQYSELLKTIKNMGTDDSANDLGILYDNQLKLDLEILNDLYPIIKLNAINMIAADTYVTKFAEQDSEILEKTAVLLDTPKLSKLKEALVKGYREMFCIKFANKATTFEILHALNGKSSSKTQFQMITWANSKKMLI